MKAPFAEFLWNGFRLAIVALALVACFITLAWLSSAAPIPRFLQKNPASPVPTSLTIHALPSDAMILMDGRPYEQGHPIAPGQYSLEVSRPGYVTAVETIVIRRNQSHQVSLRLMPETASNSIAENSAHPVWDANGRLFFFNRTAGSIQFWKNGSVSSAAYVPGDVYQILTTPDGLETFVLVAEGPYADLTLVHVDMATGELTRFGVQGFAALGTDGRTLWGVDQSAQDRTQSIWELSTGDDPKYDAFEHPEWAAYGRQLALSASGQHLAVGSGEGIGIWQVSSGKLLSTFPAAWEPVWIEGSQPGLAYLSANQELSIAAVKHKWSTLVVLQSVEAPLAALPGGSEVVFTRYNPFAGGTSFWAVDTTTTGVRLLAEAAIESGRAIELSISPDGKKLAYVNHQHGLYLVTLEP